MSSESTPLVSARLLAAVRFAAERHRTQRRKDAERSPYVNHVIAVAETLARVGGVSDVDVLVAAVLHDTVEDTGLLPEELEREFGPAVRALVAEVTDDKRLPTAERKRLQIAHAPLSSPAAKLIKLADKICNVRDITHAPPADWPPERRLDYMAWSAAVVAGCRGTNAALEAEFDRLYSAGLSELLGGGTAATATSAPAAPRAEPVPSRAAAPAPDAPARPAPPKYTPRHVPSKPASEVSAQASDPSPAPAAPTTPPYSAPAVATPAPARPAAMQTAGAPKPATVAPAASPKAVEAPKPAAAPQPPAKQPPAPQPAPQPAAQAPARPAPATPAPAAPTTSAPATPVRSVAPAAPVPAAAPATPATPPASATPVRPSTPVAPATPVRAATPVAAQTPPAAATPVRPATPVASVTPPASATPVAPATPVRPATPVAGATPVGGASAVTTPNGSTRAVSPAAPMVHSPPANPRLAGVDGCPGGWVLATVDQGGKIDVSVVSEFSRVIRLVKEGQLTRAIVDIPIGLPDAEHRKADVEARRLLGKRAVCVFPAPRRETLLAGSHEEASDVRERIDGKRMAKQSFNIMPKIREVDELLDAPLQKTIHEGHPEVTFCLLNGGEPVMQSKDTPEGRTKRLQLLTAAFADLGVELEALPAKPQGASMDDVIDALALLVSALRAEKGLAKTIPEKPEYDRRGLRAEVVA